MKTVLIIIKMGIWKEPIFPTVNKKVKFLKIYQFLHEIRVILNFWKSHVCNAFKYTVNPRGCKHDGYKAYLKASPKYKPLPSSPASRLTMPSSLTTILGSSKPLN